MKHLKSYKIFENLEFPSHIDSDIIYTLKDISVDLEDIGFFTSFSFSPIYEAVTSINIKIQKREGGYFTFTEDVSESLLRIYQYMRELGWYSKLRYDSGVKKKFYIRPDDRMRNQDLSWIDKSWPGVSSINMTWSTSNTTHYTFEGISNTSKDVIDTLVWEYGEVIHDMNKDIEFIEDKLLELSDLGYFTTINYSPMTYAGASSKPNIYIDIKNLKSREDFYGNLGENREIIDSIIEDILEYLESSGYKIKNEFDNRIQQPSEFKFINNPVSYQFVLGRE